MGGVVFLDITEKVNPGSVEKHAKETHTLLLRPRSATHFRCFLLHPPAHDIKQDVFEVIRTIIIKY